MDITSLTGITGLSGLNGTANKLDLTNLSEKDITSIYSAYGDTLSSLTDASDKQGGDFSSILDGMMNSLSETNELQNRAESEEIRFALGESDNTHDLLIAQTKANVALQYTVAVRDKIIEAYREIMQMQI